MKCEYCDGVIHSGEKLRTRSGHLLCSYECFESFFGDQIDEDDELDQRA